MRNISKFVVLATLLAVLVACGSSDGPAAPQGGESPGEARSITFMTPPWGAPPNADALKAFEQQSGIKVEVISLPMDQLYSKVQVAAAANQEPADVIFLSEEAPSFIVAPGYVEPLNSYIEKDQSLGIDDFQRMDFWTIDNKIFGLTSYVQLVMLDYNTDKLKQAGYEQAPSSWAELREQALALKSKGVEEYPLALGATDWSWFLMALSMGDPIFDDQLNPVFANQDSKAREAMAMLVDFFTTDKLITPAVLSDQTPHAIFMSGVGTFHQSWQGANSLMNNAEKSKQAPHVSYMLLPEQHFTWSLDAAVGISSGSDNKEAAWEFIKWYTGEENQRAIYEAFGLIPSRVSVQQKLNGEGKIAQYDLLQEQAKHVHQLPRYAQWWGPWTTKVNEQIRRGFQGEQSADQIIDALAKDWNELKAEYAE